MDVEKTQIMNPVQPATEKEYFRAIKAVQDEEEQRQNKLVRDWYRMYGKLEELGVDVEKLLAMA